MTVLKACLSCCYGCVVRRVLSVSGSTTPVDVAGILRKQKKVLFLVCNESLSYHLIIC